MCGKVVLAASCADYEGQVVPLRDFASLTPGDLSGTWVPSQDFNYRMQRAFFAIE
jgi:hypothetical protein